VLPLKTTAEIAKSNGEIISPLKTTEEIARDIGLTGAIKSRWVIFTHRAIQLKKYFNSFWCD